MSNQHSNLVWDVAMLGPSSVGKTSLITSLRVAADEFFAGKPEQVFPEDGVTRLALQENDDTMTAELLAGKFSPSALPGNVDEVTYGLRIETGDHEHNLTLRFWDWPGGWIKDKAHRVEEILADCPTIIVPVDATRIMESTNEHKASMVKALQLTAVKDAVGVWAKKRRENGDNAVLIIAPVKCETYFNDNGGRRNSSNSLYERVVAAYNDTVITFRKNFPKGTVLYAPVDTIGPIEILEVKWEKQADGTERMLPIYKVRKDGRGQPMARHVKGAEPILARLVSDALELLTGRLVEEVAELDEKAKELRKALKKSKEMLHSSELDKTRALKKLKQAEDDLHWKRSKWYRRVWNDITGESGRVRNQINSARNEAQSLESEISRIEAELQSIEDSRSNTDIQKIAKNDQFRELKVRAQNMGNMSNPEYARVKGWSA